MIIGGGISGMLVARELCAEQVSVTIIEQAAQTGRESSWAGGGIISPLYPWRYDTSVNRLAQWSQQVYPQLCEELFAETGIDPEWTQTGLLIMTDDIESARCWSGQFGQSMEVVESRRIQEVEPAFSDPEGTGVWLPDIAQVRNPRLVKALRAFLEKQGVRFITGTEVEGFAHNDGRISGITTRSEQLAADRVVVASGAWSQQLLLKLGQHVPKVEPVLGQMLLFQTTPHLITRMVLSEQRYIIPRRDGRVLVGSTVERVGFNKHTTDVAYQELHAAALKLMPVLAEWPVEAHWAGLRPGAPQGIPYIYEHPEISGLYVNCGHYRNGVVLGPASAHLLVDQMLNRPPIVDIAPYLLDTRPHDAEID